MPEGPECRIFAFGVGSLFKGLYLLGIQKTENNKKHNKVDWGKFPTPIMLIDVFTIGKKVILEFNHNCQLQNKLSILEEKDRKGKKGSIYMLAEFGTSGYFSLEKDKHSDLELHFGVKGILNDQIEIMIKTKTLYFTDSRHQGGVRIYRDLRLGLGGVGLDLFNNPGKEIWIEVLRTPKLQNKEICWFLMNQKFFAGIGNYIKAEALYKVKIAPHALIKNISDQDLIKLYEVVIKILWESYNSGGVSVRIFKDLEGKKGTMHLDIYGKLSDPNGAKIVKEEFSDKRTTHWVPKVQKLFS